MKEKDEYPAPFHFRSYLNFLRSQKDLSIRQLAKLSGVSPIYISNILNGKRNPSDEVILKLAKALDVNPPDSLLLTIGRIPHDRGDLVDLLKWAYKLDAFEVRELEEQAERKYHSRNLREIEKAKQNYIDKKEAKNE